MMHSPSAAGAGSLDTPDNDNEGEAETSGEGKLLATDIINKNAVVESLIYQADLDHT